MRGPEGWSRRGFLGGSLAALALGRSARADGSFTLSNATVVLHDGQRLANAGVRVEAGRLVEVGASVKGGADLAGAWLVPGFTDAGCTLGLVEVSLEASTVDLSEKSDAVTPDARVWDGYNPHSDLIAVARVNGVTGALVHPEEAGLISGQAAMLRLTGDRVRDALALAPAAMCIQLGSAALADRPNGPKSRMGVAMKLRDLLSAVKLPEAQEPPPEGRRAKKNAPKAPDVPKDVDLKPADLALRELRRRKFKALVRAERVDDILAAIDLAGAFQLDLVVLGGAEAWMCAKELADANVPVCLGPITVQPDSFEHLHATYENAARLHRAGVRFALRTGSAHGVRELPTLGGLAVAHGLPWEAAITALTSAPGDIFGIAGWGRMEVGAPATFFQVDGDPLQPRFPVRGVWIGGASQSMETRQTRLFERYRTLR